MASENDDEDELAMNVMRSDLDQLSASNQSCDLLSDILQDPQKLTFGK